MSRVHSLFAAAERLELIAAELYRLLGERFASNAVACALFQKLEQEEIQHAARVRLLAAQYRNDPGLFNSAVLFEGAPDVDALISAANASLRDIEAGLWGDDLLEVKRRIVAHERRCVSLHAQFLVAGAPREIAEFFEELAKQDEQHEQLVADL